MYNTVSKIDGEHNPKLKPSEIFDFAKENGVTYAKLTSLRQERGAMRMIGYFSCVLDIIGDKMTTHFRRDHIKFQKNRKTMGQYITYIPICKENLGIMASSIHDKDYRIDDPGVLKTVLELAKGVKHDLTNAAAKNVSSFESNNPQQNVEAAIIKAQREKNEDQRKEINDLKRELLKGKNGDSKSTNTTNTTKTTKTPKVYTRDELTVIKQHNTLKKIARDVGVDLQAGMKLPAIVDAIMDKMPKKDGENKTSGNGGPLVT